MDDLKPCRFCGGSPVWGIGCHVDNTEYAYRVECRRCKYETQFYPTRTEAIEAWNCSTDDFENANQNEHLLDVQQMLCKKAKILNKSEGFYSAHGVCICGHCENCWNEVCDDFHFCPYCGIELEWSEETKK